ncbi:FAD-dependent oxidoreductase [Kiritimatiellaeota bacterium B1221]|nr:FAD-dependent oxidoreductase [Kiritimatiellaeota bacterium B1221]
MKEFKFDVVVAGAGAGGICAAVGAARSGAKTLLIEAQDRIGGTGVFSPLGILCGLGPGGNQNVNDGFLPELYPHLFPCRASDETITYYDAEDLSARYQSLVAGEDNLEVWTSTRVEACEVDGKSIQSLEVSGAVSARVTAAFFIDGTANGNLAVMAGADFQVGRTADQQMQPSTLTFVISNIKSELLSADGITPFRAENWGDIKQIKKALGLNEAYQRLKEEGRTSNPKRGDQGVLFFPSPDARTLVFNHTRVTGIDPTDPDSVKQGYQKAEKQIYDLWNEIKDHPALVEAELKISPVLGIREGRRIVGDYMLTQEDCLGEARFEDMVAACCYPIDIHNPEGGDTEMRDIPGSGYYHIPFRCLCAKGWGNLLLGSRCISGTHEAHSSYRVMAPLTAIGQACGVAAAEAAQHQYTDIREVPVSKIRALLKEQNQFVEGLVDDA